MYQIFPSTFFNFEFLRVLGAAPFGGAEVGECFEAAANIRDGDPESWYHAWFDQAQKAMAFGDEAKAGGDKAGASWAYIRASNYYRAAEFLLHCKPDDERILAAAQASSDAFDKGWVFLDATVKNVQIPYEDGKSLPGRLFLPASHKTVTDKIPIIVQTGGFDSTLEELYYYGAAGALPRGYAVLAFDGPGQGLPLRRDKLRLRPDWEHVTSKVLDFLIDELAPSMPKANLDLDRIAVLGSSLGGYFALRAAADPRIKACISCDGTYDMFDVTRSRMPPWFINGWLSGWISDAVFNRVVSALQSTNLQMRWEFGHSQWAYGVETPADVMRFMARCTLKSQEQSGQGDSTDSDEYLSKVQCATLVTGAEDSFYFTPPLNSNRIFEKLTHLDTTKKHLWNGKGVDGGGMQAKIASLALYHQKMFGWLDKQFGIHRETLGA